MATTPLLEREAELDRLAQVVTRAGAGDGGTLMVVGPPGIGKSALLEAARGHGEAAGFQVGRALGGPTEQELPLAAVRQLLEPLLLRTGAEALPSLTEGAAGTAAAALRGRHNGSDGVTEPGALLHGMYWLVANLAERAPVLLIADDAHWFDPLSVRVLSYLARRLSDLPVALLVASREPEPGGDVSVADLLTEQHVEVVQLAPLSPRAVTELTRAQLGADADERFCAACADAARGNPFLTLSLLRSLADAGVPPTADAARKVMSVGVAKAGRTILRRLKSLSANTVELARAVVILGADAEPRLAAELAGLSGAAAADAIGLLVGAGLLADERPLRFAHPLVAAVIRDELSRTRLSRLHAHAARLLIDAGADPLRVAGHLTVTDPAGDDRVAELLEEAGREAAAQGAPSTAAELFRRALAEPPAPHRRGPLLAELGTAESQLAQPEGVDHLRAALDLIIDEPLRLRVALQLRRAMSAVGRNRDAVVELERLLPSFGAEARSRLESTIITAGVNHTAAAELSAPYAIRLVRRLEDTGVEHLAEDAVAVGAGIMACHNHSAARAARIAATLFEWHVRDAAGLPWWTTWLSLALLMGDHPATGEVLDWGVDRAERLGDLFYRGGFLANRAWWRLRRGEVRAAEVDADLALAAFDLAGAGTYLPGPVGYLCEALVHRGELAGADELLARRGLAGALDPGHAEIVFLQAGRGRLRAAQGRFEEAADDLRAVGDRCLALGIITSAWVGWRSDLAEILAQLGRMGEARRLAAEDLELAGEFGTPRVIGAALRGLAAADPDHAEEHLAKAVATLDRGPALELVRALTALGTARRRRNDRAGARKALVRAMDTASTCGATRLAELARAELVAAGGKPRRTRSSGVDALTPTELRVATMAAAGSTNKQIAQAMFLTVKTVESHLSQTYQKLDITGRTDLAAALDPRPTGRRGPR
ncbi:MAG TPA: AAA family ATPase [Actinophytocola sp.]|uniref:helix-turn-helix transcriptional regulator n=1 Tax=Actinophytocola sp. TaxID=1872138 RepID=UPI002DDC9280|nr:AAA family ATPase [Actinophytocola sp.]HEV2779406.1 AAA family ATPase [Actinophytocola sp.]